MDIHIFQWGNVFKYNYLKIKYGENSQIGVMTIHRNIKKIRNIV